MSEFNEDIKNEAIIPEPEPATLETEIILTQSAKVYPKLRCAALCLTFRNEHTLVDMYFNGAEIKNANLNQVQDFLSVGDAFMVSLDPHPVIDNLKVLMIISNDSSQEIDTGKFFVRSDDLIGPTFEMMGIPGVIGDKEYQNIEGAIRYSNVTFVATPENQLEFDIVFRTFQHDGRRRRTAVAQEIRKRTLSVVNKQDAPSELIKLISNLTDNVITGEHKSNSITFKNTDESGTNFEIKVAPKSIVSNVTGTDYNTMEYLAGDFIDPNKLDVLKQRITTEFHSTINGNISNTIWSNLVGKHTVERFMAIVNMGSNVELITNGTPIEKGLFTNKSDEYILAPLNEENTMFGLYNLTNRDLTFDDFKIAFDPTGATASSITTEYPKITKDEYFNDLTNMMEEFVVESIPKQTVFLLEYRTKQLKLKAIDENNPNLVKVYLNDNLIYKGYNHSGTLEEISNILKYNASSILAADYDAESQSLIVTNIGTDTVKMAILYGPNTTLEGQVEEDVTSIATFDKTTSKLVSIYSNFI